MLKKILAACTSVCLMASFLTALPVGAADEEMKFVVLQDFENITTEDLNQDDFAHCSAEISSDYRVDGEKSLKITGNEDATWGPKRIAVDTSKIDLSKMSTAIVFFKTPADMLGEGKEAAQLVIRLGVSTTVPGAEEGADPVVADHVSTGLGKVFDYKTKQFIAGDLSAGQGNMMWIGGNGSVVGDARNKEFAAIVPLPSDVDKSKITHVFLETHEPIANASLYVDRIIGVEGEYDGFSTGFLPVASVGGAPEVAENLFMIQDFDSFDKDADLKAEGAILSVPNKDGKQGTAIAVDTVKGRGGVSAKIDFADEVLAVGNGEPAFKAGVMGYGPIQNMDGAIIYVKMPNKPANASSDTIGFKPGFEGSKGSDYIVYGLRDATYARVLNPGENVWRHVPVSGNDIYLPYGWEGYVEISYDNLVMTYPAENQPDASIKDLDFSPMLYGYFTSIGGDAGAAYLDDIMFYNDLFDGAPTAFAPENWMDREGPIAGTINIISDDELSVEDIIDQINNSEEKTIAASINQPEVLPKEIFAALKGKDKELVVSIKSGDAVSYRWAINGKDVTNTEIDFETNILFNGSIFQDDIVEATKFDPAETLFISTVAEELPGKMKLSAAVSEDFGAKANVYLYDIDEEKISTIAKDAAIAETLITFDVAVGGEYFVSVKSYSGSSDVTPGTDDKDDIPETGEASALPIALALFTVSVGAFVTIKKQRKGNV